MMNKNWRKNYTPAEIDDIEKFFQWHNQRAFDADDVDTKLEMINATLELQGVPKAAVTDPIGAAFLGFLGGRESANNDCMQGLLRGVFDGSNVLETMRSTVSGVREELERLEGAETIIELLMKSSDDDKALKNVCDILRERRENICSMVDELNDAADVFERK